MRRLAIFTVAAAAVLAVADSSSADKSATIDLGKDKIHVVLYDKDDAKAGLCPVGRYHKPMNWPLSQQYKSAVEGNISKGGEELIGRLDGSLPAGSSRHRPLGYVSFRY